MRRLAMLPLVALAGCGVISAPSSPATPVPAERDCSPLLAAATLESTSPADTTGGIAGVHHRHAVAMHEYHRCLAS